MSDTQYPWRALPVFADVARRFLRPLDLPAILEEILGQVESFGYRTSAVLLVDKERQEIYPKASRGYNLKSAKMLRFRIGDGIGGWVAYSGQPYYAPDVREDPLYVKTTRKTRSEVAFPFIADNRVIGVLDVTSARVDAFPGEVREELDALATLAALAIDRAQRDEELHKLILTDDLTGLANHRGLWDSLEREAARARRFGHSVSLLLVEIDKFKRVNDQYGHLRGDAALRAAADAIKKVCRTMDLAARAGGDEFVLLLPHTPKAAAVEVAERLRRQVEALSFPEGIHLTASLGVAAMPDDDTAAEGLMETADRRMYQAKRAGGNRVAFA